MDFGFTRPFGHSEWFLLSEPRRELLNFQMPRPYPGPSVVVMVCFAVLLKWMKGDTSGRPGGGSRSSCCVVKTVGPVEKAGKPGRAFGHCSGSRWGWARLELVWRSWGEIVDRFELCLKGRIFGTF